MKILLYNTAYASGVNGSILNYVSIFFPDFIARYLFPKTVNNRRKIVSGVEKLQKENDIDLILLVEDKRYSGFENKIWHNKYGDHFVSKLTFMKENGNAFISGINIDYQVVYLKNGIKKLLYIIDLEGGVKLVLFHFSLSKKTRVKQLTEISKITKKFDKKIICGDFNIMSGFGEIEQFIQENNLVLSHNEATFPTYKPKKYFDLFLCSPEIQNKTKVLYDFQYSDHLPVLLEIQ